MAIRQRADLSHLPQDFMTALQWFIRIQKNQIHLTLACQIDSSLSRIINEAAEAFFFELELHETADTRIMFDD